MGEESGFHPAERPVDSTSLISPRNNGPDDTVSGVIFSTGETVDESGNSEDSDTAKVDGEASTESITPDGVLDEDVEEARELRTPHNPGKPTKKEIEDHLPLHWPFRSWCRHCVLGRAVSSPHRARTEADREFARERIPTISMDHCFLGSARDEESAHSHPYLILYDGDTEAVYAIPVEDKTASTWLVELVTNIITELGYGGIKIAVKIDGAKDLRELRKGVTAKRSAPTVPLDVPTRE